MQKEVSVKNINMQRRSQLPLFSNEDFKSYFGIRVWIKDFYETIAHSISGGERKERELVDELSCEPDIEDWKRKMWIEVKASKINNYFGLIDKQLKNYERLLMNRFPWTNPKVEYIFFTYNIKKVFEECHNEESLIERLAQNTVSMLAMPLDIVGKIWEKSSRYNGSVYESFRYFKRSDANLFLSNLGEAFNKFDIKKEDYKIVKKKFSAGYSIEGAEIKQFDILKISHNGNYDRWLSDFRKNKESD